jgi:FMN phosphatase YigB (HAD superfamily)
LIGKLALSHEKRGNLSNMSKDLVGRKIRCLLFDLGDTLWYRDKQESWEKQESAANQRAMEILRQHVDNAQIPSLDDQSLGRSLRQAFDEQIGATIRRSPLLEPHASQIIAQVLQSWGINTVDSSLGTLLFEALRIRVPDSRPLFSDTLSTLAELHRRGFLLGIVTNRLWGGKPFYADLEAIGLLEYFNPKHIAVSGDLGIRKPNAQIFEYILNELQVVPQETAMIGDSLSADILGTQPLGIYTVWKPKPWLRDWALAHATSQPASTNVQSRPLSSKAFPGIDTADSQISLYSEPTRTTPTGVHVTDDDYIMAQADMSRGYLEQFQRGEIRPDKVIGELSNLLVHFHRVT